MERLQQDEEMIRQGGEKTRALRVSVNTTIKARKLEDEMARE